MKVTFTAEHDTEINSMYQWFRRDRDLVRSVDVGPPTGSDREAMGAIDTVAAVSSTAIGLGQLAYAFLSWHSTRPAGTHVTVTRPDGTQLAITGGPDLTVQALTAFLAEEAPARGAGGRRRPRRSRS